MALNSLIMNACALIEIFYGFDDGSNDNRIIFTTITILLLLMCYAL